MTFTHEEAKTVWEEYKLGLAYKRRMGFLSKWPEYERFKAGDQWPAATERTKNLPRPVFNMIEMVEAHKVSSVMNEQIKMVFSTQETDDQGFNDASDTFSRYSDTEWENVKQNELNEEALEDGSNRGTCIWHYYWDPTESGGNKVKYQGVMCGETIDPMNFFPGNPQQRKVQKQPYIIITSRENVSTVKQEAQVNGLTPEMIETIQPDKDTSDQGYDMAQVELGSGDQTTVVTKYWKANGRIWFKKVASGLVIKPDTDTAMRLYPIALMQWKRRKKSIFGIGDTEGLIPNQKAINFLMAMQLLSVQLTGWPKLLYKKGAIDTSKVTNTPGEMVADSYQGQGFGVDYLRPGSMSGEAQVLVDKFMQYTREVTGANEAATGQAPSSDLNATAIMLLQKASGIPIESIKRRFYQAMEDVGRIWEEFWKVKYNITRQVKLKDDDGNEYSKPFRGSDYQDVQMNLKIDIGPSSTYSESLMMSSLDNFLSKNLINFQQYLKYVPKNVVPFKDRLLKEAEQGERSELLQTLSQLPPPILQQLLTAPPEMQQQMLDQIMAAHAQAQQKQVNPSMPIPNAGKM